MKKLMIIPILMIYLLSNIQGQEQKKIELEFHGFVKTDYFFDSRQTVGAREGHFLLFPKEALFDSNDKDINAVPNFNILSVQTRLKAVVKGPDFYGAKTSALIEGAFFGQTNADINGFRLRHAFAKFSWDNAELLMGQYWHPHLITSCYAGVHSFNTGVPFQPFSRNPQIRFSYGNDLKVLATLYSQRDFSSRGPNGTSSEYLRNSGTPALNLQFQYSNGAFFGGAGVDYKTIRPVLSVDENIPALSYIAFMKLKAKNLLFKVEGTLGENLADQMMIGGIAEYQKENDQVSFTNINSFGLWTDVSYSLKHIEFGVFGGYSKSLGLEEKLFGSVYALGGNIDNLWRVSARTAWKSGPTKIGIELENTVAQYGVWENGKKEINIEGKDPVTNLRVLVIAMYSF